MDLAQLPTLSKTLNVLKLVIENNINKELVKENKELRERIEKLEYMVYSASSFSRAHSFCSCGRYMDSWQILICGKCNNRMCPECVKKDCMNIYLCDKCETTEDDIFDVFEAVDFSDDNNGEESENSNE